MASTTQPRPRHGEQQPDRVVGLPVAALMASDSSNNVRQHQLALVDPQRRG
jgi:hypothetical protein